MREIGAAALNLLLDDLGGSPMPPRRVELACHLIERQSTAPARDHRSRGKSRAR
jgi:DNA-binding LacI/PurR family transcriptional regulator